MLTEVPPIFARMVDDAAVFPPGSATMPEAFAGHREYRHSWYQAMVGPLLLPADRLDEARTQLQPGEEIAIGVIGELGTLVRHLGNPPSGKGLLVRQVEVPVAKRQEDPMPGLAALCALAERLAGADDAVIDVYAEIPLTWGLLAALDEVAARRADGLPIAPKFRAGGLAAELFPTPMELAAVICACRDRQLPFKLTAGLHHAIRHNDAETGFVHHGFLNVLAATMAAVDGAEVLEVAGLLGGTDPVPLVEAVRPHRRRDRPLWIGFGSCSVPEPLADLRRLGLLNPAA